MNIETYFSLNRKMWNDRVDVHLDSAMYDLQGFKAGKSSLNEIEIELLGDIRGKQLLHLQCHFGQDTLSLARMGARVTGVDFSDKAIDTARELAKELELEANFLCSDVLELEGKFPSQFDTVFSSYGTITWLPELGHWAKQIHDFLVPGGKFILVEFHPVVWMYDYDFTKVEYGYFNSGPIIEETSGSYADRDAPIQHQSVGWNHSLDEVLSALLATGLELTHFREYDYSPYAIFKDTVRSAQGYQIGGLEGKLPLVYSVVMQKKR